MTFPHSSKPEPCEDTSIPSPICDKKLDGQKVLDDGFDKSTDSMVDSSASPKLDYAEIVRTLQHHAKISEFGCLFMFFLTLLIFVLWILAEICPLLFYAFPFCVLLGLIFMIRQAIQARRFVRKLTRLTGCRCQWYSFKPEVIEQVQQLLAEAGIDPKADPDGDPAAFCPRLSANSGSGEDQTGAGAGIFDASTLAPKPRLSLNAFILGLFWAVILFVCFAVLAGGVSIYFLRQSWSVLHHPQQSTFNAIRAAQAELKSYYDLHGSYPKTFSDFGNETQSTKESSNKKVQGPDEKPSSSQAENKIVPTTLPADKAFDLIKPPVILVQQTENRHVQNDGWDRPLYYGTLGTFWRIVSYGADGKPGGDGLDADIEVNDALAPDFESTNDYSIEYNSLRNEFMKAHRATWKQIVSSSNFLSCVVGALLYACLFCIGYFFKPGSRNFRSVGEFVFGLGMLLLASLVVISFFIGVLASGSSH